MKTLRLICDGEGWTSSVEFGVYDGQLAAFEDTSENIVFFDSILEDEMNYLYAINSLDEYVNGCHMYFEGDIESVRDNDLSKIDYSGEDYYAELRDYLQDMGITVEEFD